MNNSSLAAVIRNEIPTAATADRLRRIMRTESPKEGATREALEETGFSISQLKSHGVLNFYFGQKAKPDWIVYVFSTNLFKGKLVSNEEGILQWFPLNEVPYDEMWEDDKHWLPLLLEDKRFKGDFYFNKNGIKLLDFDLNSTVKHLL